MVVGAPSQSAVGRLAAERQHGIVGMLKNPYVTTTCLFAALGTVMYGYDQGVMSPILVMENFQAQFPSLMGDTIQGWLVAALELGAWFGALLCGYLADKISRKYTMEMAGIVFTLGTCLQCAAVNPGMLFAGRIIGGVGIGMFSMVIPLYQAEIAPPELRGSLVSLQQLSITIGTTVAFWLDYGFQFIGGSECKPYNVPEDQWYLADGSFNYDAAYGHECSGQKDIAWRFPIAFQMLFAWILLVGMFFLPFSPRWLAMKHRDEECIAALCKLRRLSADDPVLRAEFLEIKAAVMFDEEVESELKSTGRFGTWRPLFAANMQKRVWIGIWLMIFQQFTGINSVLYYAPQIFQSFGLTSTTVSLLATGVTGILQVIFTIPSVLYLDRFGRKSFLICGAIGMMVCHAIVAGVEGSFMSDWSAHAGAGWVAVVFIWLFAVNFAYSWGPVTWVLAQEIFPNSLRSQGVAVTASTNWMFNFVIGLTTKDMLSSSGMSYGTYIFFACFCGMGAFFVWKFVPETKDKTLEELDMYFGGDNTTIAAEDKARMDRIYGILGLTAVERPEDLNEKSPVGIDVKHHDSTPEPEAE